MEKEMYVIFTEQSSWGQTIITEDQMFDFNLEEDTQENWKDASGKGYKFAQMYEEREDQYGNTYYQYVTTRIIL